MMFFGFKCKIPDAEIVVQCSGFSTWSLRKTKELLDFNDGIGGWRMAKDHHQIHHTGTQLFEQKPCDYVDIQIIKSKRINVMDLGKL